MWMWSTCKREKKNLKKDQSHTKCYTNAFQSDKTWQNAIFGGNPFLQSHKQLLPSLSLSLPPPLSLSCSHILLEAPNRQQLSDLIVFVSVVALKNSSKICILSCFVWLKAFPVTFHVVLNDVQRTEILKNCWLNKKNCGTHKYFRSDMWHILKLNL